MNKKLRRIVAIIALVFVGICTVSIVLTMANSNLLNGQIGFLTLYTGGIGLALFAVIKITDYRVRRSGQLDESADSKDNSNAEEPVQDAKPSVQDAKTSTPDAKSVQQLTQDNKTPQESTSDKPSQTKSTNDKTLQAKSTLSKEKDSKPKG